MRRWRLFLDGQPHLHRSGRGPSARQILGFLSIYGYALLPQNYQIWRDKTCRGGACILGSVTPPISGIYACIV